MKLKVFKFNKTHFVSAKSTKTKMIVQIHQE